MRVQPTPAVSMIALLVAASMMAGSTGPLAMAQRPSRTAGAMRARLHCPSGAMTASDIIYAGQNAGRHPSAREAVSVPFYARVTGRSPHQFRLEHTRRGRPGAVFRDNGSVVARLGLEGGDSRGWRVTTVAACVEHVGTAHRAHGPHREPLDAQRDTPTRFYKHRWQFDTRVHLRIDDGVPRRWRPTVRRTFRPWNNRADGNAPKFVFNGIRQLEHPFTPCVGPNAIFRANLPRGYLGYTPSCVHPGDEQVTGVTMVLDRRHFSTGSQLPRRRYDLLSVSRHEAGHATGWFGHFRRKSKRCDGRKRPTMCPAIPAGTKYFRTLRRADKLEIDRAYYNPCPPTCREPM